MGLPALRFLQRCDFFSVAIFKTDAGFGLRKVFARRQFALRRAKRI